MLRNVLRIRPRSLRFEKRRYHEVSFASHGDPSKVLFYKSDPNIFDQEAPPLYDATADMDVVRVEMMHVPWNPADINTVQGKYPSPYPPSSKKTINESRYFEKYQVAGSEGWGRISSSSTTMFEKGSLVTVGYPGMGTMRSSVWAPSSSLLLVRRGEELLQQMDSGSGAASTLFQLGGTALRMLTDFVDLHHQPGEVVLQNAGNSGVGFMASQLAASKQIKMVSLVRRGSKTIDEYEQLVHHLTTVGKNALVVAEEDLIDRAALAEFQNQLRDLSITGATLPKLALNAVGGASATILLKSLAMGGTLVTYGGMSMEPVVVATPQLIFKDLQAKGYWHSRWMIQHDQQQRQSMIDELVNAVLDQEVKCPPTRVFGLSEIQQALECQANQESSVVRSKVVLDCRECI
jgi:trans-2-enoyl-CoA reductase